jgi:hypothetical protein
MPQWPFLCFRRAFRNLYDLSDKKGSGKIKRDEKKTTIHHIFPSEAVAFFNLDHGLWRVC